MNASQRSEDPVLLVRKRAAYAGERDRTCHLVPMPDGTMSDLVALCGERISLEAAELLSEPDGMPCVPCLLATPTST
jgi:hypothetical protein